MEIGWYWINVVSRAFLASMEMIGQTPFGVLYALVVLVILALLRERDWEQIKASFRRNALEVIGVSIVVWLPFFLWHLAKTPYSDIQKVKSEIGELRNENVQLKQTASSPMDTSDLKSELRTRESEVSGLKRDLQTERRFSEDKDRIVAERDRVIQRQDQEMAGLRAAIADLRAKGDEKESRKNIRLGLSTCFMEGEGLKRAAATAARPAPTIDDVDAWINKCAKWIKQNLPDASYFSRFVNPEIDKNEGGIKLMGPGMTEERSVVYRVTSRYTTVLNRFMDEFR